MTSDYFPPYFGGGVENVTYEISKKLVFKGQEVHVLTSNNKGTPSEENLEGIFVHRVDFINLTKTLGLQTSISLGFGSKLENLVKSIKPDLINTQNIFFYSSLMAARKKEKMQYPLVTTLHLADVVKLGGISGLLAKTYEQTIGKYIINRSDRLIAVCKSVCEHALALGANYQTVDVIPNTVDSQRFKPRNKICGEKVNVVFVGRLISNKGPHLFIEAAHRTAIKLPNVSFSIIGDGPMRKTLEKKVSSLGLGNKIFFLGKVADMSTVLPDFDILVRPSLTEGMPLTLLEGMACGLAVISSNVAGVPEIIQNKVTGLLTPPGDLEALVSGITQLATDKKLLNTMKIDARKYIESYLNWDNVAEMTLESYRKVLET